MRKTEWCLFLGVAVLWSFAVVISDVRANHGDRDPAPVIRVR